MKLFFQLFLFVLFSFNTANASVIDLKSYYDCGAIYSHSYFPLSVANEITKEKESIDFNKLKKGESKSRNWFGLIDVGNSGIDKARKNGNISKIYYVDNKICKIYVPYFIIPVYIKEKTTIVYGE